MANVRFPPGPETEHLKLYLIVYKQVGLFWHQKWFKENSKKQGSKETQKGGEFGKKKNIEQSKMSAKCFPLHFPLLRLFHRFRTLKNLEKGTKYSRIMPIQIPQMLTFTYSFYYRCLLIPLSLSLAYLSTVPSIHLHVFIYLFLYSNFPELLKSNSQIRYSFTKATHPQ